MAIVRRNISEVIASREQVTAQVTCSLGKVIMGVDPGTNVLGYAVIEIASAGKIKLLVAGVLKLGRYEDKYQKLRHIFERLSAIVTQYKPDEMALEAPFYGENVQSMLKLGRAQGVAMVAALTQGVPVFEYAPTRVKQAITGRGAASKEQVAALLSNILEIKDLPKELDATDALSVAVCHHFTTERQAL